MNRDAVLELTEDLLESGADGGYIMSAGALIDHARPENVDAWVTTTKEYGRYR